MYSHPYKYPYEISCYKIVRSFLETPIGRPLIIDHPMEKYNTKGTEVLIKVELYIGTIICVDHTTTPAVPKNMTNYTDS